MGNALNVQPHAGIGKVLLGDVALEDALISTKSFGDNLRVLLVDRVDVWLAEVLSLPTATVLLEEAERLADYVVIDAPPLTEVIDALPIAKQVDDVVLVVRPGSSNLAQLNHLGDLLAQNGITPNGFVLVGVGSSDQDSYYFGNRRDRDMSDWFVPGSTTPAVTETLRDGERSTRRRERSRPPERDRGRGGRDQPSRNREQPRDQARERDQPRERDQARESEQTPERDEAREREQARERDRVQRAN